EMHILISDHRDGELITQVVARLGFSVVRGSSTRGGSRALRELTWRIDRGHLCVTPDGPHGPRRRGHQRLSYLPSRPCLPSVAAGRTRRWWGGRWRSGHPGGRRAGLGFVFPGPSAPPPVSSRPLSVSPPTRTATPSRRLASKSNGACRLPCWRRKPGSNSFDW